MTDFVISRKFIGALLLSILAVHVWAVFSSAYFNMWWLDIAMHFSGGFWVGLLAIFLIRNFTYPDMVSFWLVLGLSAIIGVFWEFFEFGMNEAFLTLGKAAFLQPSIEDILGDLLADMLGGTSAFILFKERNKNI